MAENFRTMIGLVLLIFAIAVFVNLPHMIEETDPLQCVAETGQCLHEERIGTLAAMSPFLVVFGFILGVVVFYFLSERRKTALIRPKKETLLMFLSGDEKKIVEKIIMEGGRVLQSEVSRLPGLGKVRAHRVTERLFAKGLLEKERHGKTNLIKLAPSVYELFSAK